MTNIRGAVDNSSYTLTIVVNVLHIHDSPLPHAEMLCLAM